MLHKSEKGFAPIIVIFALTLLVGTGAVSSHIKTTTEYPKNTVPTQVLGDESEQELTEQQKEELEQKEEELRNEKEELKRLEQEKLEKMKKEKELTKEELKKQEEKIKLEKQRSLELKRKIEEKRALVEKNKAAQKEQEESSKSAKEQAELEAELKKLEKELKVDTNNNKVEYEQRLGDLKIKYSYENGKLKVKAQAENGAEIEVDDAEINMIKSQLEQQLKESGIEISTSSSKLAIGRNKIKAKTNFPISVDPETNQLIVTTPVGQKVVTVLPDQAIQNMLSKKVLSEVEFEQEAEGESNGDNSEIELENRNDQMVYKIKGKKEHKLIGFIPVKTETTAYVSAENGEVVAKDESLLSKLIDYLSI